MNIKNVVPIRFNVDKVTHDFYVYPDGQIQTEMPRSLSSHIYEEVRFQAAGIFLKEKRWGLSNQEFDFWQGVSLLPRAAH